MLAYALASKPCFEATNMLYFLMDCCGNLVRFDFPDYFYLS